MSHGVENMAYVNEVPWHGLGAKLEEGAPLEVWQKAAGLEWEAEKAQLYYDQPEEMIEYEGRFTLIRSDTKAPITGGVVGSGYVVVQPKQVLEFFSKIAEDYGAFKLETAGCLFSGRKIWALARAANDDILFDATDKVIRYLLLATSYDLSIPTIVQQTSVRVVCNNTLTSAVFGNGRGEAQIRVSHKTAFSPDKVRQRMMLDSQWKIFIDSIQLLRSKKVTEEQARTFFFDVYYPPNVRGLQSFSMKSADRRIGELMAIYRTAPGQELESAKDTAWGLVNAVTYQVDHAARSRSSDLRLDKAWFGTGLDTKELAAELAYQLASN